MARWQDYILRGIRADQPSGSLVTIGTLYCVTDESDIVERWSGSVWEAYSPTAASGDVAGPASSVDSEIVLFNGVTGKLIKSATGTGPVHATSGVYSVSSINLATEVTGDLPYANLTPSGSASRLLGRGSSGAGDWEEISLGSNLSMTGTVLDSTGGSGGSVARDTNGFRPTLATGQPVYAPQAATPSATDTTNEIVTFSADPGWYNGTIVTPASTVGGLTAGTTYYMHRITSTTYSFHTTVAAAMSGASRVDLTATINVSIIPSGISATGIYLTPYASSQIALYDGYDWVMIDHAEFSVGLGTLSADTNYDLFLDYNGGTPVLSIGSAWTNATTRAVDLIRQDGVWVSSADAQSRYVGTFRTNTTTTTIDDGGGIITNIGGKRFLYSAANQVQRALRVIDTTDSWSYTTGTWRQARATAGNQVEVVVGLLGSSISARVASTVNLSSNSARGANVGVGVGSTTAPAGLRQQVFNASAVSLTQGSLVGLYDAALAVGYQFYVWLESGADGTSTFLGDNASTFVQSGLNAMATGI